MSRRPARVTQADIRRAIAAAKQAGANMAVDILPDGTIRLVPVAEIQAKEKPRFQGAVGPERRIIL